MKIEFTLAPSSQDIDFLTQQINQEKPEFGTAYPFGFMIRDTNNHIIAGCNGSVIFGAIYTDQLWVHKDYRSIGIGRKLMDHVYDYGRQVGCTLATVATMSFQAAHHFYEKLGYVVDFDRPGYVNQSRCIFMKLNLI